MEGSTSPNPGDEPGRTTTGTEVEGAGADAAVDPDAREEGSQADEVASAATEGDQGPWEEGRQDAAPATAPGFDPDRPVRTSPPTAGEQSGVPSLPDERNAGVAPGTPGPVEPALTPAEQADREAAEDAGE